MANAMLDARQEDGGYRRVEPITGQRRRRRWTAEEKARIVAESFEEGANISEVARRHEVVRGLLTVWRRQVSRAVGVQVPGFVPVRIDPAGSADGGACKSHGDDTFQRSMPRPYRDRVLRGSDPRRAGRGRGDAFDSVVCRQRWSAIAFRADLKIWVATQPVDFRKSIHTLSALVSEVLRANPFEPIHTEAR
jgi:transposase